MKTPKRKTSDDQDFSAEDFQGRGYHGNQGNMDIYSENEGYFSSVSPFYGDLPEEKVDTEEIDKEFKVRYDKMLEVASKLLTPDQMRIFDMYFIKCLSQSEVAKRLNVSQQYVAKASARVVEILREHEGEAL